MEVNRHMSVDKSYNISDNSCKNFLKVTRFVKLYGLRTTIFKVWSRAGLSCKINFILSYLLVRKKSKSNSIGVIGCGQFAFATIGRILSKYRYGFRACYNISEERNLKFAACYRATACNSSKELLRQPIDLVYIASNHASHAEYALEAMEKGCDVYIEKPISVSFDQFEKLVKVVNKSNVRVYVGYNRPFSKALLFLKDLIKKSQKTTPLSMNCFISGHLIPPDHWYRDPQEGTRVCGNLGHWLDLFVHVLNWKSELPSCYHIKIQQANEEEFDDDLVVCISTNKYDILSVMLTARTEPFEGINETINFQLGDVIAKIDDFRHMTVWQESKLIKKRYFPKDVGHKAAVLQPFNQTTRQNWKFRFNEVKVSTLLMLQIADMVRSGDKNFTLDLYSAKARNILDSK